MNWDFVMAGAQAVLGAFILPTLWNNKAYVPRISSGVYAIGLGVIALTLFNLDAPMGGAIAGVSGVLWAVVFLIRGESS